MFHTWMKRESPLNFLFSENVTLGDFSEKVIGKFKDEAAGVPIREFVGLR